jgi:imidazolonepropionase-like amidohydrolase
MKKLKIMAAILFIMAGQAYAQATYPLNDVANPKQDCYAFIHATVVKDPQTTIQNCALVIRKSRIEAVGSNIKIPADAVVVDCKAKYIYPSFIDIYSDYGVQIGKGGSGEGYRSRTQMLSNTKGAYGWNQAIRSETDAVRIFSVDEAKAKDLRSVGFGTVLTQQMDGISRGTGALVTLDNEKENLVIVKDRAAAGYSFKKGSSTQDYPGSLMGCIALLRQNYLDAQWYKTKPASEGTNISLQAFLNNLDLPQIFDADDVWNDLRANKIATEFGANYIIKGGGNEYQRIAEMQSIHASFILPLNFPMPMDVQEPTDARYVSLADLKHWEMAPVNPGAFEKANINFALTSYGIKDMKTFFVNLRRAIQQGLSEQRALEALTKTPATLAGVYDQVGSLEAGKLANFIIVSAPVFSEQSIVFQNWVRGKKNNVNENGWNDFRGTYHLTINGALNTLVVKGDVAKPTVEIISKDTSKVDLTVNDKLVSMLVNFKKDSLKNASLTGFMMDSIWSGTGMSVTGQAQVWTAVNTGAEIQGDTAKKKSNTRDSIGGFICYPFDGYGFRKKPIQEDILIKNATIWTSEKEGILPNSDLLIKNGKIAEIGKNLSGGSAKIIDGSGMYLSPGIIDEHSHIAATGGINECTQSVTSEVRIADVIDPEDISIYRLLAGGVTSSHILHGSCNVIGGQTQLIKMRWGDDAEEMKFAGWDPFIKFALGENVKRSSLSGNNRFPDTRMGVDELLTDAFTRARDYEKKPPGKRRDLELDALVEILNKKRFITCHSYVQSEITALMRVADTFHFTINTFTHILEGYKVADKMKAHGANASTFSDWWGYKNEVIDAIPQNPYIMQQVGLNVAINSDDAEMARHLNQEAAKSVKYAGMSETDALDMVTINPAKMLHVDSKTGSIKLGKDADLVLWTDNPLSIYAVADKTIVEGIVYYDRAQDSVLRLSIIKERARLIQKMITAKKNGEKTIPAAPSSRDFGTKENDSQ